MQKPIKGSHYLPRTYLKHFLLDDKLFMYKKGKRFFEDELKAEQRIIEVLGEKGLNNVAKESNLYRIEAKDIDPNFVENLFREMVEDDLDKIIGEIKSKKIGDEIGKELKERLCWFMSIMRFRTPHFKSELDEMSRVWNNREKAVNRIKSSLPKKYSSNNDFLKSALSFIAPFEEIFYSMKMQILKAREGRYFITSDNPVVYFVPEEKVDFYNQYKSLVSPFTQVFFDLTKDYAIHLCRRRDIQERFIHGKRENVDIFNYNISHNSKDFLFSPIKMEFLNQFIEEYIPYPFKLESS